MATTTIKNVHLKVTVDGTDHSCQFITANLTLPGYSEGDTVEVACPEGQVVELGEAVPGEFTGKVYTDTADAGITWVLAQAAVAGTPVAYEIVWFADQDNTIAFQLDGTAQVGQMTLPWEKPGLSKHDITLTLSTNNGLKRPAAA